MYFFCVCISILDLATITMAWFWCFKQKLYFVYFFESLPDCCVLKMKWPLTHWLPFFFSMCNIRFPPENAPSSTAGSSESAFLLPFYWWFVYIVYAVPSGCVVILVSSFHRCHPRSRNPPDFVSLHRRFQLLTHFDSRFWVGLLGSWCLAKILVVFTKIFGQGFIHSNYIPGG